MSKRLLMNALEALDTVVPEEEVEAALETEGGEPDVVHMDIPLLIRMFEFSREDAKDDAELHRVAERLTEVCQDGAVATMSDYNRIVGTVEWKADLSVEKVNDTKTTTLHELIKDRSVVKSKPVSDSDITKYEKELDLKFGKQFRSYLKEFGALTIDHFEFYGICGKNQSVPSAIHVTKQERKLNSELPGDVTVIYNRGDGVIYAVDEKDNVFEFDNKKSTNLHKKFDAFIIETVEG